MTEAIIIGFIGSGAFASIVGAIINAFSSRKGVKSKLKKIEKDSVRLQLLLLMSDYPDEKQEIMEAARYYFITLKGDWYLTSLFSKWLKQQKLERPDWFAGGEEE